MGVYVDIDEIKPYLVGKVRFTNDISDSNNMQESFADELISEAEAEVEHDLSPRYLQPFQTDAGEAFSKLPAKPTKFMIKLLCKLKSVIRILETDFGTGSAVEGEKYKHGIKTRYDELIEKLLCKKSEKDGEYVAGFKYPPLPGLRLNYMNETADDGFAGAVLVSTQGDGGYPSKQINDPSENWWNGRIDDD